MNNNNHESEPKGSSGIPGPEGKCPSPANNGETRNRETNKNHPAGQSSATQENEELRWVQQHVPDDFREQRPSHHRARPVFRKTELHGTVPHSSPDAQKKIRRKSLQNLKRPGSDISYQSFETVFRDFICSLMERQDMMKEELFLHIADLSQQIDDLERRLENPRQSSPDSTDTQGRSS